MNSFRCVVKDWGGITPLTREIYRFDLLSTRATNHGFSSVCEMEMNANNFIMIVPRESVCDQTKCMIVRMESEKPASSFNQFQIINIGLGRYKIIT